MVVRGVVLWLLILVLARPVASLYGLPQIGRLLPLLGLSVLISGFNSTSLSILNRRLALGPLTLVDLGSQLVGIAVMICWAYYRPSVWALVGGNLAQCLARLAMSHGLITGPRNRFAWSSEAARSILSFGRWIWVGTAFTFAASRGDRLVLGGYLDMQAFGLYWIAYQLAYALVRFLESYSARVLLPLYARSSESGPHVFQRHLLRARTGLLALCGLPLIALALRGSVLVSWLYDERYQGAGWMLQILAAGALGAAAAQSLRPALLAVGDSYRHMLCRGAEFALLMLSLGVGFQLGAARGLVVGAAVAPLLGYPLWVLAARRHGVRMAYLDLAVGSLGAALLAWNLIP